MPPKLDDMALLVYNIDIIDIINIIAIIDNNDIIDIINTMVASINALQDAIGCRQLVNEMDFRKTSSFLKAAFQNSPVETFITLE